MPDFSIAREQDGDRVVFRLAGIFDRVSAWTLRDEIDGEQGPQVVLDFSHVRDFSDLGLAVLAHGLADHGRRVLFRGLRQHQLRIFRYCGIPVEEMSGREASVGKENVGAVAETSAGKANVGGVLSPVGVADPGSPATLG